MNEISATQRPGSTGNLQRVGFLALLPRLLRSFGVEPAPVLSAVGLQDNALDDPNKAIPYVTMGRLMERAAQVTGCSTFGLELGKTIGLSTLGPVGELMRNSPTVRAALQTFATHHHRNAHGGVVYLIEGSERTLFGYAVYEPNMPGGELICDGAAIAATNLLAELTGSAALKSAEVLLSRRRPET